MPTFYRRDEKPVVQFDPQLEMAPFVLFRRLREGQGPLLVDIRQQPTRYSLEGAIRLPSEDWLPEDDTEVVVFDERGDEAVRFVQRLHEAGFDRARALFGGLDLYRFALDPETLGTSTFLVVSEADG